MKQFKKITVNDEARVELHDSLALTGAEISINVLPQGASVPFVHSHKQNEEIYGILEGSGYVEIDGEKISLQKGDWLKIEPKARRQFFASERESIKYICIQVKENSLEGYTMTDAIV